MKCFSSRLPPSSPSNPFVYYHRPHLLLRPWDLLFSGKEMRVQPKKERGEKTKRCGETGGRKKSNSITSLAPFPSFFRTFFALSSFLPTFFFPLFLLLRSYRQRRPATQKRQGENEPVPPVLSVPFPFSLSTLCVPFPPVFPGAAGFWRKTWFCSFSCSSHQTEWLTARRA